MRYAIVSPSTSVKAKLTNDVGVAFDHMVAENRRTGQVVEIRDRNNGRLVRSRGAVAELPALKLSDAMTKALFADEAPLVGLPGAPNTLKALEARGLVKRDNVGVARLTSLGRQYRAQKKG